MGRRRTHTDYLTWPWHRRRYVGAAGTLRAREEWATATGRGRALLELAPGPNGGGGGVVVGGGVDLPDNTTTVSHLALEDPIIAPC